MVYTGNGGGDYVQEVRYVFVGEGGDFSVERPPRRDSTRLIVCCLAPILLIAAILWLCRQSSAGVLDCDTGFETWEKSWSQERSWRCCEHYGRGCPATSARPGLPPLALPPALPRTLPPPPPPAAPPTMRPPPPTMKTTTRRPPVLHAPALVRSTRPPVRHELFNCTGNTTDWSADRRAWCCRTHKLGCDPFNCAIDFAYWQTRWSMPKRAWCCRFHHRGCPGDEHKGCEPAPPVTFPLHDCEAGYANWVRGWSAAKRVWCCKHSGRACEPTPGVDPNKVPGC